MFETIARLSIRFRWLVLALWIVIPLVAARSLPQLSSVTTANNAQFLSAGDPSQRAAALAAPFQGKNASSTAILVASRSGDPLTPADDAAINRVEQAVAGVPGVTVVRDQGTSRDGQALKALVATSSSTFSDAAAASMIDAIRHAVTATAAPPGLSLHLTGPLAQVADAHAASMTNGENIRKFALLFVIVLLSIVFRAALAPLVTLLPAVLSLVLAGPLIAQASMAGMPVSPVTEQLLAVLLIGAGTDYGLFLVFRTREEIRRGALGDALTRAIGLTGGSITSAGIILGGTFAVLALAGNSDQARQLGLTIAFAVFLDTFFVRTLLVPSVAVLLGRWNWWPSRLSRPAADQVSAALPGVAAGLGTGPTQSPTGGRS